MTKIHYPDGHVLLRDLNRDFPVISRGQGVYLFDEDDRRYFDGSSGALVVSVGHGNETVARKVYEQIRQVGYVNGTQFTAGVTEKLAARLASFAPGDKRRVSILSSGSEVVEAAIKFCRQLWVERGQNGRSKIIARTPGYHGNTLYALSASARPRYKKFFGPLLADVIMIPAPYEYRSAVANYEADGAAYYADALEQAIIAAGPETVSAFIVEPVIGSSAGASVPPPGYFERVSKICQKYGVLTIADEVLCGAGRTGRFFASEHFAFDPDILVLGKGIGGGLVPVSAMLVRERFVDEIKAGSGGFMHAQTYLQAPVMSACGLAVLDYFREHALLDHVQKVGKYFQQQLRQRLLGLDCVGHISGIGLLAGIEFVADKASKRPFDRSQKFVEGYLAHAFSKGLILWPNTGHADGTNGDLVMVGPPLVMTEAQVDELIELLVSTISSFSAAQRNP